MLNIFPSPYTIGNRITGRRNTGVDLMPVNGKYQSRILQLWDEVARSGSIVFFLARSISYQLMMDPREHSGTLGNTREHSGTLGIFEFN